MNHELRLPEDHDAERVLLATLAAAGTLDPGAGNPDAHTAVLAVQTEFFVDPSHRAVIGAIKHLYSEGQEIHALSIKSVLEANATLDRIGGFTTITEILAGEEVNRPTELVFRIADLWKARRVMRLGTEAINRASSLLEPVDSVIFDLSGQLMAIGSNGHSPRISKASRILDRISQGKPFRKSGTSKLAWFGIPRWDEALETSPGHLVIVAARPGVGKTALAIQGSIQTAAKGHNTLLISLEMDEDEVDSRLASWLSKESARDFRDGRWSQEGVDTIWGEFETLDRISSWCQSSNRPLGEVEAAIRDAVRVHGVSSVWLDYFTLIQKPDLGRGTTDAACWGKVSTTLKRLAQDLGICIVLISQLNREGDAVEPKLSDLRETGQLEQDANAVIMLWPKDAKALEMATATKSIYGKIAKNRSGAAGWKVELSFHGSTSCFAEIERQTIPAAPRML